MPTNMTAITNSGTGAVNSTHVPSAHLRGGKTEAGIDKETGKSATGPSTAALPTEGIGALQSNEPNSSVPLVVGNEGDEKGKLWNRF